MEKSEPTIIPPECHAPGCHHNGEHALMAKCRVCDHWYCTDHLDTRETLRRLSLGDTGMYFLGLCAGCSKELAARRSPVDSSWLR